MSRVTGLTRRGALTLGGAAAASIALKPWAWAQGKSGLHGLSINACTEQAERVAQKVQAYLANR